MLCSHHFPGGGAHCNADAWKTEYKEILLPSFVIGWANNHEAFSCLTYIFFFIALLIFFWMILLLLALRNLTHTDLNSCRKVCSSRAEAAFWLEISALPWESRFPDEKKCIWYVGYSTDVPFNLFHLVPEELWNNSFWDGLSIGMYLSLKLLTKCVHLCIILNN